VSRRTPELGARLEALGRAVELGERRCDPELLAPARALLARAAARRRLSPESTVVALAGGTGSGKSTLFNALAGEVLAPTGVRRPTTSRSRAAIWPADHQPVQGGSDVSSLLDWLEVRDRLQLSAGAPDGSRLAGLILVDLPDFDSTAAAHRLEAERMTGVVDLLVWVLDPQKYADAAVHQRYLRPLAGHHEVMMVVLNQADRLDADALDACRRDLSRLLSDDGLTGVPVLATSAVRGDGLAQLRAALAERVSTSQVAVARLHADTDDAVGALEPLCGSGSGSGSRSGSGRAGRDTAHSEDALVHALAGAAGVGPVTDAAARSYRMRAVASVGWPLTRWLARLRPDPLRRLHLGADSSGLTSRPAATGAQRAQVSNAVRELVGDRTRGLAPAWQASATAVLEARQNDLPMQLDQAVRSAKLSHTDRPSWWAAVRGLQYLWLLAAVTGMVWLAVLAFFAYLRLPGPDLHAGRAPVPTLLLIGGVALGLLTSALARPFVATGAARRRARARRSLDSGVREVARSSVLAPLEAELKAATEFCQALAAARR
jgi:energy-coupling factor transporter ATP-binding protein EcfA2